VFHVFKGRTNDKKRLFLTASNAEGGGGGSRRDDPPSGDEAADHERAVSDDVLVISFGAVNDCPGMQPEQKVRYSVVAL